MASEDQADPHKQARNKAIAREVGPLWQSPVLPALTHDLVPGVSLAEVSYPVERATSDVNACSQSLSDLPQRLLSGKVSGITAGVEHGSHSTDVLLGCINRVESRPSQCTI